MGIRPNHATTDSSQDREHAATEEAILDLHTLCVAAKKIGRRLHLPESAVEFCIQTGELPRTRLEPQWKPVTR